MKDNIELKPNQTILFIGDSITDAGRCEPPYQPFGNGYVHFTANYLFAKYCELNISIINTGIGGNTIRDIEARWLRDCLNHEPDVLSVLIGINDLWRTHTAGLEEAIFVEEYESVYRKLLSQVREQGDYQLILLEPFMFCNDESSEAFKDLRSYIKVVHRMAEQFDAVLVPLQSAIDEQIKTIPPEKWSDDMVHPYTWAHAWISQRWIEATKL